MSQANYLAFRVVHSLWRLVAGRFYGVFFSEYFTDLPGFHSRGDPWGLVSTEQ
ncbi:MAG: hypothetical protein ACJA13_004168 [Paraglaciecola sp.]